MRLTGSGKALIVTMVFRLLFGGYLVAQDHYAFNDTGSALTVLGIYVLLGIFTALFLFGKRLGLNGIMWLSVILIISHTAFTILALVQGDTGVHNPVSNLWSTLLRYPFFLLTLIFSLKVYREKRKS